MCTNQPNTHVPTDAYVNKTGQLVSVCLECNQLIMCPILIPVELMKEVQEPATV